MTELRLAELTAGDIEATIGLDLRPARERFFAPVIRSIDLYAPAAPCPRRAEFAPTAAESRAGSATETRREAGLPCGR